LVWVSALTGVLAIPFLIAFLPSWRLPILPSAKVDDRQTLQVEPKMAPVMSTAVVSSPHEEAPERLTREWNTDQPRIAGITSPVPATLPTPPTNAATRSYLLSWNLWAIAVWSAGAIVVLVPMLVGQARLEWLNRRSARLDDGSWIDLVEQLRASLALSRRVTLFSGERTSSPMTWGVLRPKILLPAGAEDWPRERLRAVLLHELGHVKRWDCLTQILARIVCAVYWFHPLVWVASSRLRVERERACDDLVLLSGSSAADYAEHLLEVARTLRSSLGLAAVSVPMARASQIEGRLLAILDRSRNRRGLSRRGAFLLLIAVGALLLPLSATRLRARSVSGNENASQHVTTDKVASNQSASMTVSGRVFDETGRPVGGAKVLILGRRKLAMLNARVDNQYELLGRGVADLEGKFQLEVPRSSSVTYYEVQAMAAAPGHGMGWVELNRDAKSPSADVKLMPEQVVEGRLVDLQGLPGAGVLVKVASVGIDKKEIGRTFGVSFWKSILQGLEGIWPESVRTDNQGRFRIRGIGSGVSVGLDVDDPSFARQSLNVTADVASGPNTLSLQPAMRISGRVTCADTGEPLRNAIVIVESGPSPYNSRNLKFRTGDDGRYEANPAPGKYLQVTVYPPVGSPYLIFGRNFEGNDNTLRRVVDLAVPRGVLITGRITERGSGRALSHASVYYSNGASNVVESSGTIPGWMAAVPSNSDGRYSIAVTPGKGHLVFYGPTADFVHEIRGQRELDFGKPGGTRYYAHAFRDYDAKSGQEALEIDVSLQPGVTVKGRVVGPDGQPVHNAEIITTLYISPFHTYWRGDFTIPVRDGRFELHGVPTDRPVPCSFLDAKNGWGATLEVTSAMAADEDLTVKLAPCGSATARIVDEQDNPVQKRHPELHIIGSPGPGNSFGRLALSNEERDMLTADEAIYANVDRLHYWNGPHSDSQGRVTLPYLIPGATYRVYEYAPDRGTDAHRWRDFTLKAGQTLDLGNIRAKASEG